MRLLVRWGAVGVLTFGGVLGVGVGSAHAATCTGTNGDDVLSCSSGADTIDGLAGNDTLYGGDGDDLMYGRSGWDNVFGQNDNDTLWGGDNPADTIDWIDGGNAADILREDNASGDMDMLCGEGGADTLHSDDGDGSDGDYPGGQTGDLTFLDAHDTFSVDICP